MNKLEMDLMRTCPWAGSVVEMRPDACESAVLVRVRRDGLICRGTWKQVVRDTETQEGPVWLVAIGEEFGIVTREPTGRVRLRSYGSIGGKELAEIVGQALSEG